MASLYRDAVLSLNPLRYLRLSETSGTAAADEAGAPAGTYTGVYELGVPGLLPRESGVGLGVNGLGGMVTLNANLQLQAHSVALWYRRDGLASTDGSTGGYHQMVQFLMGPQGNLYVHNDGYVLYQATRDSDGATQNYFGATNTLGAPSYRPFAETGSMHFIVATYNGTTMRLYIDGVESGTGLAGALRTTTNANLTRIGRTDAYKPNGAFDEAAIWNRALTASEVAQLYDAGIGRIARDATLRWKLGGIAILEHSVPFDVVAPPLDHTLSIPFELSGGAEASLSLPFTILGKLSTSVMLAFDVIEADTDRVAAPEIGVYFPPGMVIPEPPAQGIVQVHHVDVEVPE